MVIGYQLMHCDTLEWKPSWQKSLEPNFLRPGLFDCCFVQGCLFARQCKQNGSHAWLTN